MFYEIFQFNDMLQNIFRSLVQLNCSTIKDRFKKIEYCFQKNRINIRKNVATKLQLYLKYFKELI